MSKWISFQIEERRTGAKTDRWGVWALAGGEFLGQVKWYAQWRKYCFFPAAHATLFEQDCLRDIATFIESETEKHRKGRRAFSEEGTKP